MNNRIEEWRASRGMSQERLAEATSLGVGTISRLQNGKMELTQKYMRRLSQPLGCAPAELLPREDWPDNTKTGPAMTDITDLPETLVIINEVDVRASGGGGAVVQTEERIGYWGFPQTYMRNLIGRIANDADVIEVIGDSMEPVLSPGDRILVDRQQRTPIPPGIFVLSEGDLLMVKRLQHVPNSDPLRIRIKSDNPEYDTDERTVDELNIIGRVVGAWHRL